MKDNQLTKKFSLFATTTSGRGLILFFIIALVYLWHANMQSKETVAWIVRGGGTYGQVFDLGMMIGAFLGVAIWLCIPKRN